MPFLIKGIEGETKEPTEFLSNAETAEAARQSAESFGIEVQSVTVVDTPPPPREKRISYAQMAASPRQGGQWIVRWVAAGQKERFYQGFRTAIAAAMAQKNPAEAAEGGLWTSDPLHARQWTHREAVEIAVEAARSGMLEDGDNENYVEPIGAPVAPVARSRERISKLALAAVIWPFIVPLVLQQIVMAFVWPTPSQNLTLQAARETAYLILSMQISGVLGLVFSIVARAGINGRRPNGIGRLLTTIAITVNLIEILLPWIVDLLYNTMT